MTEAFPPATVYGPVILWERPVQLAAADFIKPGDTVFDVGGNTGGVAIAFSRMVGPQGRVLSFECNPRMIAWIRQDLESNAVNNVELVEKAAYCRADEMLSFFLDDSYYAASSSLYRDFVGRAIQVTTTTIDEVVQSRGVAPSVIKVDVEGGEADVLAGAAESIRKHRPIFILEYAADAADYLDLLWSLEYDLWDVNTYAKVDSSY